MHVCSDLLSMIHFADDTTVYTTGDNFDAILTMLNVKLEKIDQWLQCNRLSQNVKKLHGLYSLTVVAIVKITCI